MARSDINNRLPRFHEIQKSIKELKNKGGLEGVSESVQDYLDGAESVGLDNNRVVVYSDSYHPQNGPAVLTFGSDERPSFKLVGVNEAEVGEIERIYDESGLPIRYSGENVLSQVDMSERVNATVASSLHAYDRPYHYRLLRKTPHGFALPRVLALKGDRQIEGDTLGSTMAHEADHWDFYLNEVAKLQHDPKNRYTFEELRAIAEKRGYATTMKISKNLGHAAHASIDQLSRSIEETRPRNYRATMSLLEKYCKEHGLGEELPAEIGVFAMLAALGKGNTYLTRKEHKALKQLRVV
jgi:hypothetical protein